MNKTFILAFNFHEAKSYIKGNPNDYIIINGPEQLLGTERPLVKITPNAYRREDYTDIMDMIHIRGGMVLR
jgi:hypothetical protein